MLEGNSGQNNIFIWEVHRDIPVSLVNRGVTQQKDNGAVRPTIWGVRSAGSVRVTLWPLVFYMLELKLSLVFVGDDVDGDICFFTLCISEQFSESTASDIASLYRAHPRAHLLIELIAKIVKCLFCW